MIKKKRVEIVGDAIGRMMVGGDYGVQDLLRGLE
jgi:hypothetical protein